jgi:hypothetical protein
VQAANPYARPTRADKANEMMTTVVPSAIATGIKGLEALQAGSTVASASTSASGATVATAAGTGTKVLGAAASTATIVGGIYGAYDLIANWGASTPAQGASSGMAVGAALGTVIGGPGFGTAIGAAIGTIAGGLIGAIQAGKHKDQKVRDQMREALVNAGILDSDYKLPLADGTMYNMGRDGGPRAEFGGLRPYEIDSSNPLAKYAISWVNPLVELIAQGNPKLKADFVGYFTNAALTNAKSLDDVRKNVNLFVQRFGLTDESLAQAITKGAQSGALAPDVAAAYINGIQERNNPSFMGSSDPKATAPQQVGQGQSVEQQEPAK